MRLFFLLALLLILFSCNSESTKTSIKNDISRPELSDDSKIFLGNRLFSEKTCIKCHAVDKKKVGPSVVNIMSIYKEQGASIVAFLKGETTPIVDTNSAKVAMMKANIDGFLKNITDEELDAISFYMLHVDKLNEK
jgi:cytochrome c